MFGGFRFGGFGLRVYGLISEFGKLTQIWGGGGFSFRVLQFRELVGLAGSPTQGFLCSSFLGLLCFFSSGIIIYCPKRDYIGGSGTY